MCVCVCEGERAWSSYKYLVLCDDETHSGPSHNQRLERLKIMDTFRSYRALQASAYIAPVAHMMNCTDVRTVVSYHTHKHHLACA